MARIVAGWLTCYALCWLSGLTSAACFLGVPVTLGGQIVWWLRYGVWEPADNASVLNFLGITYHDGPWLGMNKIAHLVLWLPLWTGLFATGAVLMWLTLGFARAVGGLERAEEALKKHDS